MFDSVIVKCDKCEGDVEFQSKAGECSLHRYGPDDAPIKILADIDGDMEQCANGHLMTFKANLIRTRTKPNYCPNCGHDLRV